MLLTVGISLYSTRLILQALGSTDFGIFNLIAGVIAMLAFLNNAMATATQRFLSFYQGKKDLAMQKKVFSNSLTLHLLIGFFIVCLLKVVEPYIFENLLNIPSDRVDAAKAVYQWMIASVFCTVLMVPFTATLIAHENMLWVAVVGIIEVLLKLSLAFMLFAVDTDRLVIYAMGMAVVNLSSLIIYAIYSFNKFEECTTAGLMKPDMTLTKELSSFTGWNLFGALCGLGRTQGFAILLNMFFGTVINAAYGIANQVASQMNFFSATLLRAINPQIMKSEGAGDRQRMLRLAMTASKFGFFLFAIIAIPCIFEMESILAFWLKEVPAYTVIFCQLTLLSVMINQLTIGLQSAIQATGKIKMYQIVVGTLILFNLPIAYILLKNGFEAYTVLISYALVELLACSARIYFLKLVGNLSVRQYFKSVFLKELIPVLIIVSISYFVSSYCIHPYRFILTLFSASSVFAISIYLFGLESSEKLLVHSLFNKLKMRKQIAKS